MSEQPVTLREHIHQALLAAGPVGLTMTSLAETVAGPWSPVEVKDTVRRLWQVGELARRQDGTFVLTERTAKETRPGDRELDEAVRRVADRARRASHQTEIRVRRVDPALLRAFCPTCRAQVMPRLDGRCPACGTQTGANLDSSEQGRAPRRHPPLRKGQAGWGPVCPRCGSSKGQQAHMCSQCRKSQRGGYNHGRSGHHRLLHITEELLADARRMYASGLGLRQVAAELHPHTGYKTVASCAEGLYRHFKRCGWKLRPQREVTAARNYKHGRKPRKQTLEQQNAYRRWLGEQRGWQAVQGPGRPKCKGVKRTSPEKGRPCQRHALTDSEYCHSHDPRRAPGPKATSARRNVVSDASSLLPQAA
jgi:hypothetical protein